MNNSNLHDQRYGAVEAGSLAYNVTQTDRTQACRRPTGQELLIRRCIGRDLRRLRCWRPGAVNISQVDTPCEECNRITSYSFEIPGPDGGRFIWCASCAHTVWNPKESEVQSHEGYQEPSSEERRQPRTKARTRRKTARTCPTP